MSKPDLIVVLPLEPFAQAARQPAAKPDDVRVVVTSLLAQGDLSKVMIFPAPDRETVSFKKRTGEPANPMAVLGTVGRGDFAKLCTSLEASSRGDANLFALRIRHATTPSVSPMATATTETLTHS